VIRYSSSNVHIQVSRANIKKLRHVLTNGWMSKRSSFSILMNIDWLDKADVYHNISKTKKYIYILFTKIEITFDILYYSHIDKTFFEILPFEFRISYLFFLSLNIQLWLSWILLQYYFSNSEIIAIKISSILKQTVGRDWLNEWWTTPPQITLLWIIKDAYKKNNE
jgi:hypothetical protein